MTHSWHDLALQSIPLHATPSPYRACCLNITKGTDASRQVRVTCSLPKWSDPKQLQPTSTETLSAWRRALANYLCCEARKRVQGSASCYHVCIAFSCLAYYQPGGQTEELASVCSYQRASRSQSLAQRQQAVHCSRHYTVFARLGC